MSTNCLIYLKLRKEDFGKKMKSDINKLPIPLMKNIFPCEYYTLPKTTDDDPIYIGVYCHFDGNRSGVGDELIENFKTYEDVLNLILLGDLSCCLDNIVSYKNWRNDPLRIRKIEGEVYKSPIIPYMYVFEDDNWNHSLTYE